MKDPIMIKSTSIIALATLILTACSPASQPLTNENPEQIDITVPDQTTTDPNQESNLADTSDMVDDATIKTFEIEAGSFYYTPNEIRVNQGDVVRLVMTSVDMMHDLVIDELDVNIPVTQNGNTNEVTFVANEVGQFEMYCSVGNHRAQGQVGTLIVE